MLTSPEMAQKIDHTVLSPEASSADVHRLCTEAMEHGFYSVCVAPVWVARVATMVRGSGVRVCAVVGFPHGTSKPTLKAIEATSALKDGADEVDLVAHLPPLMSADAEACKQELLEVVRAARATRRDAVLKVIVETAVLMKDGPDIGAQRLAAACRAVREGACDFIKTSTGFHPAGGASIEAVRLLAAHAGGLCIKASGGISDLKTAQAMLDAGAHRLGCSRSVKILNELRSATATVSLGVR